MKYYALHDIPHDVAKGFQDLFEFELCPLSLQVEPFKDCFDAPLEHFSLPALQKLDILRILHDFHTFIYKQLALFIVRKWLCIDAPLLGVFSACLCVGGYLCSFIVFTD